jgi:hypothetical protein
MKSRVFLRVAGVFLFTLAVPDAFGQVHVVVTVDENGHGNVDGQPLGFGLSHDSLWPNGPSALSYGGLPWNLQSPGDLILLDQLDQDSDLVRFGAGGGFFFFSELPGPGEARSLADVGGPPTLQEVHAGGQIVDLGGGIRGCVYTVNAGGSRPGSPFFPGGPQVTYIFETVVPEPGSTMLATIGMLGLLIRHQRTRGTRTPASNATARRAHAAIATNHRFFA